jgi:DNA repair exonuclease SbcCD ATPase subunit
MSQPKLRLPQIENVKLRRFSLFTANPDAEFQANIGVVCLVGANGIGKSTLLSAINFAMTGTVSDPSRQFESMEEYYKFTRNYSSNYFRGRIEVSDEEEAEIVLSFRIGVYYYEIRRGLFEPDELRGLTIRNAETTEVVVDTEETPRGERHRVYVTKLVEHIGVASFEEFVFLQHFVFTFDEQRKTLFWNSRIMDRVLYRAFGAEPDMAKRADSMKREIEAEDSRVRNYQWEATRMRKRINEIRTNTQAASGAQQKYEKLIQDHEVMSKQFDEQSEDLGRLDDTIKDANLRLAEYSVHETSLRDEYARFFDKRLNLRPALPQHPFITQSIADHLCGLCGSESETSIQAIEAKTKESTCPLCDSTLHEQRAENGDVHRLQEVDREIAEVKKKIGDTLKTLERLRTEEAATRKRWQTTKNALDEFDAENSALLDSLRSQLGKSEGDADLTIYREQLAALEKDKKTAYDRREQLKSKRAELQKNLELQYLRVEQDFVPRFAELAQQFLGMPLTVQMDATKGRDIKLVVTVRGTTRRQQQELSESQRFFLDIALRMALTQHMSDPSSKGGMYIDTPEGSLDIAYEKRAGEMLAMFAQAEHRIIMTANLNSSQLLLALAHQCGSDGMRLCRMTDWAELSEVQREEEDLFDTAYDHIEKAMTQ